MTAPLPVYSAKLSIVGPGLYYGGGPRWNPGCCSFAPYAKSVLLLCFCSLLYSIQYNVLQYLVEYLYSVTGAKERNDAITYSSTMYTTHDSICLNPLL